VVAINPIIQSKTPPNIHNNPPPNHDNTIQLILKKWGIERGNSVGPEQGQVAASCEHDNEYLSFMNTSAIMSFKSRIPLLGVLVVSVELACGLCVGLSMSESRETVATVTLWVEGSVVYCN
jgi:hypothetical protein